MPKISVVIPVYGHAEYVFDALDSVLAQSYDDFEVIVINDGSPDASESVLEPYIRSSQIRYVCQGNKGVAAARNHGLSMASGEFITFLDDDDLWPLDKLDTQINQMKNFDAVMVGGSSHIFLGNEYADEGSFVDDKFKDIGDRINRKADKTIVEQMSVQINDIHKYIMNNNNKHGE